MEKPEFEKGKEVKLLEAARVNGSTFIYGKIASERFRNFSVSLSDDVGYFFSVFGRNCYVVRLSSPDDYTQKVLDEEKEEGREEGCSAYDEYGSSQQSIADVILPESALELWVE